MSETLTFSGGSFELPSELPRGATPYRVESVEINGQQIFEIESVRPGRVIRKLDLAGDTDSTPILISNSVKTLTTNFGDSNDTLILSGKKSENSSISFGDGDDNFSTETGSRLFKSSIDAGDGDDQAIFGGRVGKSEINLGGGADQLIFDAKVRNVGINLGNSDGEQDVIRFQGGEKSFKNVVITGADENDILFIGSSQYNFNSNNNLWINANDPSDTRDFS